MHVMAKKNKNEATQQPSFYGFKPVPEDHELIGKLKAKLGIQNYGDLVRYCFRRVADAEGLRAA